MKPESTQKLLRYIPRIPTALCFIVFLLLAIILFLGRKNEFLRPDIALQLSDDFYQHVSNLSLSYLIYSGIGYTWLLLGLHFRYIVALGALLVLTNFVYELWIPLLNVPDITDAYYGLTGTLLGFVFLIISKQFGLKSNTE